MNSPPLSFFVKTAAVFFFIAAIAGQSAGAAAEESDFAAVIRSPALSDTAKLALAQYAAARIFGLASGDKSVQGGAVPSVLNDDRFPRIVFISVSGGRKSARIATGSGQGIGE